MKPEYAVFLLLLIPVAGFISALVAPARREDMLAKIATATSAAQLTAVLLLGLPWLLSGAPSINAAAPPLYSSPDYTFSVDLLADGICAPFLVVGALLTLLITRYSRYYLHREEGYKRFFATVLLFFFGYNLTVLAGNFETLFLGWELLGVSSFLLVAFYRDRYLPVRNAVKVFTIYRIGDVGILLAMWASHHFWHNNITFSTFSNEALVDTALRQHSDVGLFIALMLLLAAAVKSAQLPFSSWLARAMEGPTPSSAIFYGSLSVHFGVFLLLRTYPFWQHQTEMRILVAAMGLASAALAAAIGRVQSTVKSQIAYASIAQIGLMFVEVALGLHWLALLHFAGNAFLRTYQLLVSPSVVSYRMRDQLYNAPAEARPPEYSLPAALENTLFLLSLKEWYLERLLSIGIFRPMKRLGKKLDFLSMRNGIFVLGGTFALGMLLLRYDVFLPMWMHDWLPETFAAVAFLLVLKAFSERRYPRLAWLMIATSHLWIALAVSHNVDFDVAHTALYLSGVVLSAAVGYGILAYLRRREPQFFSLNEYYGHAREHRSAAVVFLLAALGLMGFPVTPSFLGEDLLLSHIGDHQVVLAALTAGCYVVTGMALIRLYARLFLGPQAKRAYSAPLKSA